jgi:hypothetical protein
METLIKADIFFFISSVGFVILSIMLGIALFYFIRAGKNLYDISESIHTHFKESEEFFLDMKDKLENNLIFRMLFPTSRRRKTTRTRKTRDVPHEETGEDNQN